MMAMMIMGEVNQQRIKTNGIWMNIAEKGTGPLVLLLHGFPEFWFGWRHQITDLAKKGYHVVAPDLRGYGDSDSPLSPSSYSVFHIVADLIGLLDHFGQQQEAGRAEKAFARYDYVTVMKKLILINKTDLLIAPQGMEIIDYLETPCYCPKWITEEELEVFADKFQESGFTGPLNYYRAIDLNWELLAPWQGSKITVPVKLIVGDKDIGFECGGTREYIQGSVFKSLVPNSEVVILDGHHFIHQERPQEVSNEILSFLSKFSLA
ncbi:uncharacterized protein LOC114315269 isoform X3 [Camellia sinensis]|uniref:uncharacterized protein LOC114315269 isoform X3 n=1 Tax=Camellia sinensis TaxID=4442 RepID=UPI001035FBE4|nr:uncharacterized protein LOC114315269 isoform X3 [Camellia sinensis]